MNIAVIPEWNQKGDGVILRNDLLPLEPALTAEREVRSTKRLAGDVNVVTREARPVEARKADVSSGVQLQIEESIDNPWVLVAVDPADKGKRLVFDPNPKLRALPLARKTVYEWKTDPHSIQRGIIYWPRDFTVGKRYPLVIQTHGVHLDSFSPEGYGTTGYAAEMLAAAGFVVAQIGTRVDTSSEWDKYSEGEKMPRVIDSLIDQLVQEGVVDQAKVGVQGFSRSCYHVLAFLTQGRHQAAAAICYDGIDMGYYQALTFGPRMMEQGWQEFTTANGGEPFGAGLDEWRTRAPGFNLHKVDTPLRLVAMGSPGSVLQEWEPFAVQTLRRRPVELQYLPEAPHNVVTPWDRFATQQGAVDWFRFWLQGYERIQPVAEIGESTAELSQQYERWRKQRDNESKLK